MDITKLSYVHLMREFTLSSEAYILATYRHHPQSYMHLSSFLLLRMRLNVVMDEIKRRRKSAFIG